MRQWAAFDADDEPAHTHVHVPGPEVDGAHLANCEHAARDGSVSGAKRRGGYSLKKLAMFMQGLRRYIKAVPSIAPLAQLFPIYPLREREVRIFTKL